MLSYLCSAVWSSAHGGGGVEVGSVNRADRRRRLGVTLSILLSQLIFFNGVTGWNIQGGGWVGETSKKPLSSTQCEWLHLTWFGCFTSPVCFFILATLPFAYSELDNSRKILVLPFFTGLGYIMGTFTERHWSYIISFHF